jgi:hypothetical protein
MAVKPMFVLGNQSHPPARPTLKFDHSSTAGRPAMNDSIRVCQLGSAVSMTSSSMSSGSTLMPANRPKPPLAHGFSPWRFVAGTVVPGRRANSVAPYRR